MMDIIQYSYPYVLLLLLVLRSYASNTSFQVQNPAKKNPVVQKDERCRNQCLGKDDFVVRIADRSLFNNQRRRRWGRQGDNIVQLNFASTPNEEEDDDDEDERIIRKNVFSSLELGNSIIGGETNARRGETGNIQKQNLLNQMAELYTDDQMARLLMIHTELVQSEVSTEKDDGSQQQKHIVELSSEKPEQAVSIATATETTSSSTTSVFSSLHDIITYNLDQSDAEGNDTTIDPSLLLKSKHIKAIASDVDGTLITSEHQIMHPRTRSAIMNAIVSSNVLFFPATGKSRAGALKSLGSDIKDLLIQYEVPGVFLGGLLCIDGKNNVLYENKLSQNIVYHVEQLVKEMSVSIVGYDGDAIYTNEMTNIVKHLSTHYGEPMPQLLHSSSSSTTSTTQVNLSDHQPCMHKLLIMDEDTDKLTNVVRPKLEELALEYGGSVTQALPTMLEVIPDGCSKAKGVQKVCDAYGIRFDEELLAIGDAENDVPMLQMASIGIAVGNANSYAKDVADHVLTWTCEEGGAGRAIERFVQL